MDYVPIKELWMHGKSHHDDFKEQRVLRYPLSEMAKFQVSGNNSWATWAHHQWNNTKSKWIPQSFNHGDIAAKYCKDFVAPMELVRDARNLSRELVQELVQKGGVPRNLRNQTHGRFDAGKTMRILADIHKGSFSPETTRPFKHRERVNPSRPHVGIVADGSWGQFWSDSTYLPRIGSLMMGVSWACEAVGCGTTASISRGSSSHYGKQDMCVLDIVASDELLSTNNLAVVLHPELYRQGLHYINGRNIDTAAFRHKVDPDKAQRMDPHKTMVEGASDGGRGVAYLKAMGATITVAIGNIIDSEDATIHLSDKTPLPDAVKQIAGILAEQNKRMGL